MINRQKSIVTYVKGFTTQALQTLVKNMELQLQVIQLLLLQFNNGSISYESQQQKRKKKIWKRRRKTIL